MASVVPVLSDLQSGTVTSSGCSVTMDATFSLIEITTTTASESFTFPATGTVDVAVDWGDGSAVETFTSTPISHTFTTAGTYTVRISGSIGGLLIDGSGSEAQFAGQFVGAGLTWTGTSFVNAFRDSDITACDLSLADTSAVTSFSTAWRDCSSLTSFSSNAFDSCVATDFNGAFFKCALDQTSVDNILVSLDTAGQSNGTLNLNGGSSASPSATGLAAKTSLEGKGWAVTTN